MRARPFLVVGAVVAALVVVIAAIALFLAPRIPDAVDGAAPAEGPPPSWSPPTDPPPRAAEPGTGIAGLPDPAWVAEVAAATGIPERALAAYAGAALVKADQMPGCGLGWATIAGVAATESDHGRHGGSSVGPDGTVSPPIYGVALDGADTAHIPDSDGGAIDGDAEFDRAVGPFQLIPQTWRNWHTDGGGDGVEDPHNIDDAAMAAANYLCRAASGLGLDFTTEDGWRAGIRSYNASDEYLATVARFAERYAHAVA